LKQSNFKGQTKTYTEQSTENKAKPPCDSTHKQRGACSSIKATKEFSYLSTLLETTSCFRSIEKTSVPWQER